MSIVITPNVSPVAAQGATAPVVLQPGTVISARVQQVLGSDAVRIAIAGQSIDVLTQVPLQAGQALQLSVSQATDGSIRLAVVNQQPASQEAGAASSATVSADTVTLAPSATAGIAAPTTSAVAPTIQLTAQESLAVSVAAQIAVTQQTGLAPLFANLSVAATLDNLPPQVQQAVAQVLAQRTTLDQSLTGGDIEQAFQSSGLFLEASLASGSLSSSTTIPDLKAALIVLRQVLTTSLNSVTAASNAPASTAVVLQGATSTALVAPLLDVTTTGIPVVSAMDILLAAGLPATVGGQATEPIVLFPAEPVIITVVPEIPTTASPTLAPGIAAAAASLQGAAAASVAQEAVNLGIAVPVILAPSTPADAAARAVASSAVLNLMQEVVQTGVPTLNATGLVLDNNQMLALVPVVGGARPAAVDEAEFAHSNVPPPPIGGAVPAAQPVLPATLLSNSPADTAMHRLLADTDGAIARQTLLQVASLPDRVDPAVARTDPAQPRWNFEIPFATPRGTAMAQFEISRDAANEVDAAKRVWRARFSLDVEPAGPVHALVSLSGDRTSVRMWAERPATAAQLRAGAAQLSQALSNAALRPGDIVIRDGTPPQAAPARAGHFLDRAL